MHIPNLIGQTHDDLDFGYMKEFNRTRQFHLIRLGVLRPYGKKRELFEELNQSPGRIIHKTPKIETPRKANQTP